LSKASSRAYNRAASASSAALICLSASAFSSSSYCGVFFAAFGSTFLASSFFGAAAGAPGFAPLAAFGSIAAVLLSASSFSFLRRWSSFLLRIPSPGLLSPKFSLLKRSYIRW
jgi:hypothetical protein